MSSPNHITALPLELHTHIFSNLQPYDILQVSQTCQALYRASSQRTVWADALHRICVENTLFEPSFPVASMSVLELQRASMGPHRWIARSSSKERNSDGILPHSVTRHLMSTMSDLSIDNLNSLCVHYLVPGGRYLFSISCDWLVLWDLGSPYSSGREPCSIATVPVKFNGHDYLVHSTPDGMGLRVFIHEDSDDYLASLYIYEIYPESALPQLTQIAYAQVPNLHANSFFSLSYDCLILAQESTLTVWDYKADTWARWDIEDGDYSQIVTTKSAVALIYPFGVVVWKIPSLLPESPLSMSTDPSITSPDFVLCYPKNKCYYDYHQGPCGWYSGTPQPLYYDVGEEFYCLDSNVKIIRFELTINSKISGGTLNLLNTFEVPPTKRYTFPVDARICQDKNVSLCFGKPYLGIHVTDIYDQQLPSFVTPLSGDYLDLDDMDFCQCPVTGRIVYCEVGQAAKAPSIIVLDV